MNRRSICVRYNKTQLQNANKESWPGANIITSIRWREKQPNQRKIDRLCMGRQKKHARKNRQHHFMLI